MSHRRYTNSPLRKKTSSAKLSAVSSLLLKDSNSLLPPVSRRIPHETQFTDKVAAVMFLPTETFSDFFFTQTLLLSLVWSGRGQLVKEVTSQKCPRTDAIFSSRLYSDGRQSFATLSPASFTSKFTCKRSSSLPHCRIPRAIDVLA